MSRPKGGMNESIRIELRHRYFQTWGRNWPEDDVYLAELWGEAKARYPDGVNSTANRRLDCLESMRECHPFTPSP